MNNGSLTFIRVALSGALSIVALLGAIWLLHEGVAIPREYWALVAVGISGVTGLDLVAYLIKRKEQK